MQQLRVDLRLNNPVPMHHRIYDVLRKLILDGAIATQQLPSQARMMQYLHVSRSTLVTALQHLVDDDLLTRP